MGVPQRLTHTLSHTVPTVNSFGVLRRLTELNKEREARIRALRKELSQLRIQRQNERLAEVLAIPKEQWLKMIF